MSTLRDLSPERKRCQKVSLGSIAIGTVLALVLAITPAMAQVGQGLSGPHYQINVIGVPKDKKVDLSNWDRRTLFVPLNNDPAVRNVKIYVTGDSDPDTAGTQCANDFALLDGNATDGEATLLVPCQLGGTLSFNVYAIGLGKPGGSAKVDAVCVFDGSVILDPTTTALCAEELLSSGGFDFEVKREAGKPQRQDISSVFRASGCIDTAGTIGICDSGDTQFNNVWIFNIPQLLDYFWQYDNNGLRHMQVRFYQTTSGSFTPIP